ncbi:MAG: hypothetical protein ACWGMZ_11445 [Thermoguttaceae bacterium]
MSYLLKWSFVPAALFASALILAIMGCFESDWFFLIFLLIGSASLIMWRRATFRLKPSCRNVKIEELDDQTKQTLIKFSVIIFSAYFVVATVILLCLLLFPFTRTVTVGGPLMLIMLWTGHVKLGALAVLTHNTLKRKLPPKADSV